MEEKSGKDGVDGQVNEVPNPLASISITLNRDMSISVTGPNQDRLLSYGLLGLARDAIHDEYLRNKVPLVKQLNGHGIMDFIRGGK